MFQAVHSKWINFHVGRTILMTPRFSSALVRNELSIHLKIFPIEGHMLFQSLQGKVVST
jgi:hypothetical protein